MGHGTHRGWSRLWSQLIGLLLLWSLSVQGVQAATPDYSWYIRMIHADAVWAQGITGKNVVVGVLDTGVDTTAPGFDNRLLAKDFINRTGFYVNPADPTIPTDPWNIYLSNGTYSLNAGGHGTSVSSLIGGYALQPLNDGTTWTYKGIAYDSLLRVGSLRMLPNTTDLGYPYSGAGIAGYLVGDSDGPIDWLLSQNVRIINNSWGTTSRITDYNLTNKNPITLEDLSQNALDGWRKAVAKNVLVVFAAGNDGGAPKNFTQPSLEGGLPYLYPELRKSWINVVALNTSGAITSYSQPAGVAAAWTLSAPGGEWATNTTIPHDLTGVIGFRSRNMNALNGQPFDLSAYNLPTDDFQLPDGSVAGVSSGWTQFLGTSAAAPILSAGAALVMQAHPDYTAQMVAQTLFTTANYSGIYADSAKYGWGLMDVSEAIKGPKYLRKNLLQLLNPTYAKGQLVADVPDGTHPSFDNNMSGDGGLAKLGSGSLTLTGTDTYTGDTDILSGTLYVDGTLSSSALTVYDGAAIGGHGTITAAGGLTIGSGATLAPGHSPTPMTVVGTVTQAAGSIFSPDLAGNGYSSTLIVRGEGNRYILTTSGTGVGLSPRLWNGYVPSVGDGYTIVTADGGVSGAYASITNPAGLSPAQSFDVLYGTNAIQLYSTPTDYRQVAGLGWNWNSNQAQIAAIWQADRPVQAAVLTSAQTPIYETLYTLNAAGLQAAAGEMSGQSLADSQAASLDVLRSYNQNLADMLREPASLDNSCQVRQLSFGTHVGTYDVYGRDVQGGGTLLNCDVVNRPRYRVGVGLSSFNSKVNSLSGQGTATLEQTGGHVYWQYRPGKYYLEGQFGVGQTVNNYDRRLTAWNMAASGRAGGQSLLGRVAVGQERITQTQRQSLSLALLGESVARDAVSESGDELFRVNADAVRDQRLAAEVAWSRQFSNPPNENFRRSYEYKLGYVHEFLNTKNTVPLTWVGNPLNIASQERGADALQASLDVNWDAKKTGWQFNAGLQGEWRRFSSQWGAHASLSYHW